MDTEIFNRRKLLVVYSIRQTQKYQYRDICAAVAPASLRRCVVFVGYATVNTDLVKRHLLTDVLLRESFSIRHVCEIAIAAVPRYNLWLAEEQMLRHDVNRG